MATIRFDAKVPLEALLHATGREERYHLATPLREQALEVLKRHLERERVPVQAHLGISPDSPHVRLHGPSGATLLNPCLRFRRGQVELDRHEPVLGLEPTHHLALLRAITNASTEFEAIEATVTAP